jgi:hypothetical protein
VLVAPGSEPRRARITLDEASVVVGNARGGVIALVASELELDADISANGYAGVWAAGDEGTVQIGAATTLYRNHLCGIAVTSGAALSLDGAAIADTAAASAGGDDDIGDGVGIFDGARADIRNARIVNSERAAILVHNAAKRADGSPDVTIEGSTFVGGKYAVVVNGAAAPDYAAANVYESEDGKQSGSGGRAPGAPADFDNADLPVATAYCEDGEACAPPASDD